MIELIYFKIDKYYEHMYTYNFMYYLEIKELRMKLQMFLLMFGGT